jgi:hypothetical protein
MDQRIESFLGDVLALAGEEPDVVLEGMRVALAKCGRSFRLQGHSGWRAKAGPVRLSARLRLFRGGAGPRLTAAGGLNRP